MSQKNSKASRQEKCERIVANIVERCKAAEESDCESSAIGFGPDVWGGNSLTIYGANGAHTHIGFHDITYDELIDQLHDLLVEGRGLSWA